MNDNRCVCCGAIIPEGRQVCPVCEQKANRMDAVDYWVNEWIFPLIVLAAVVAFIWLVNMA